ncbi:endothelin-3b [Periophthalmus magnuspinnatus]|uniref:endothelin-3b n=1 Tax=Periophthalmus magnuspinnatus TaxID=409849 RepID=UPI002436ADA6|nr:endothelin-3b [Periophthalmus magnuspinnatus]
MGLLLFKITRTPSKMLLKILLFLILQGAWVSHSEIIPEVKAGAIPNDRPTGFGGSEDLGMSRIKDAKPRLKRCTCYSYMDRECVYYCHLDIIWVNTPERTVPYGMSSYQAPQRMRRETVESPRCLCAVADADQQCRDFCQSRAAVPSRCVHRGAGGG